MIRLITFILVYLICFICSFAQVKSEEITVYNDSIELPGTLSYIQQKSPLIIWIHGSGNVDRNGNQKPTIKANYIKQLRDSLNKRNIAFFSYDKRTANPKNKNHILNTVFEDFVTDAKKVISHFKKDNTFSSINLIGHSQGSLVAMLASEKSDTFISLAGPSKTVDQVILDQIRKSAPFSDSIAKQHLKELKSTGEIKEVNPLLAALLNKKNQPFLKSWMQYHPKEEIKKVTIPTLIINGKKDLQVATTCAKNLHEASRNSKILIIHEMNHVLKEVSSISENQASYLKPDFPISKELIKAIATFVKQ